MGCPCANPPGTSKFKPIKVPRPRAIQSKSTPKSDEEGLKENEKTTGSSGINRQQYLEKEYADINKKMYNNALNNNHFNVLKKKRLSGFLNK